MLLWLSTMALGRDVVHEARPARPPEAFYVLARPVHCRVAVVVGADGRPRGAQAKSCSVLLSSAVEDTAMRWRWARAPQQTTEVVEVPVKPPSFTPRAERGACLLGFEVVGSDPRLVSDEIPPRCRIATRPVQPVDLGTRMNAAWCHVTVVADGDGVSSMELGECTDGVSYGALEAVSSWRFDTDREQRWELLVGFQPDL
ncbi:MAG: hypothetical protein KTR31_38225 [Myxococcales bacterium]|nr:hypothetical protein [Myxococcales bacterium]